ncbi:MAG TPA: YebC/PmpR family DNA-binding transcriptional regulator, partial [Brevibacterium sp.]|nr:YebC/PmpR family DNA-binding transcriptional regulator [Brevibacterium sp.]
SMGDPGSVAYNFDRKGVVTVLKATADEDAILEATLDAGAEEVKDAGEQWEIVSAATDLVAVRTSLQDAGLDYESAEAAFLPHVEMPVDADAARKVFGLIEALEDLDDVQNVYTNLDVSDEVLAELDED